MKDQMPTAEMIFMIRNQSMGVLAVVVSGNPHCGLMAYVCDDGADRLYFATLRNTTKYRAILEHPRISFLIDTRNVPPVDPSRIQALTLSGLCRPITDAIRCRTILDRLKAVHGHLSDMLAQPDVTVLEFEIHSLQLQKGPLEQIRVHLKEPLQRSQEEH